MSHYQVWSSIRFKSKALLIAALKDVGYAEIEEGEALHLYGYHGDERPETAEIVVRRKHISSASNDLGFARQPDGSYVPIISDFDSRTRGGRLLPDLRTAYSKRVVGAMQQRLRGTVAPWRSEGALQKTVLRYR